MVIAFLLNPTVDPVVLHIRKLLSVEDCHCSLKLVNPPLQSQYIVKMTTSYGTAYA